MWEELGIAPTADPKAIRRAYASRLRSLDPDRDPAAFQRLRQAFEAALNRAERPAGQSAPAKPPRIVIASVESETEQYAPPPTIDALPDQILVDDAQIWAIHLHCRSALEAGDVETAFRQLIEASAKGLLPLTEEHDIVAEFMAAAVDDLTLPGERFRFMAQHLGWDKPMTVRGDGKSALREKVSARLDAEAWYANLRSRALTKERWPTFVEKQERSLALVLLGMGRQWRVGLIETNVIRWQLARYDQFEPWLRDRIDPQRLAWLKSALRSSSPVRDACVALCWAPNVVFFILLILALRFATRLARVFGRTDRGASNGIDPTHAAWWRSAAQSAAIRGIPSSLESLRTLLRWSTKIMIFAMLIMFCVLLPPLGLAVFVASLFIRRSRRKSKP